MVGGPVPLSTNPTKEANMQHSDWGRNYWADLPTLAIRCQECFTDSTRTVNRFFCSPECAIVNQMMAPIRERL